MTEDEWGFRVVEEPDPNERRFCSNCSSDRPTPGGEWLPFTSGKWKTRRWRCRGCSEARHAAEEQRANRG